MSLSLRSNGKELNLAQPVAMGILNATPNSFYNKGQQSDPVSLLANAEKMLKEGAAILDVGGASTKPGEPLIDAAEEMQRVLPVITLLHRHFPEVWLSVDTYNAPVARAAVQAGASIVNDVSSGRFDATMLATVAALDVPYIIMHMQGTPQTMQLSPGYEDVTAEVFGYLERRCTACEQAGIKQLVVDPGFGFGKTVEHNFALLRSLHQLGALGRPVLAGLSRKSMICKPLRVNPDKALNGTTALHMVALQQGATILRAHDVKEAMEVITLASYLRR